MYNARWYDLGRVHRKPHDHHLRGLRAQSDAGDVSGGQWHHARGRDLKHDERQVRDDYLPGEVAVGRAYRGQLAPERGRHGRRVAGKLVLDHEQHGAVEALRADGQRDDGQHEHADDEVRERLERLLVVLEQHRVHGQPGRDHDGGQLVRAQHRLDPGQPVRGRVVEHAPSDAERLERRQVEPGRLLLRVHDRCFGRLGLRWARAETIAGQRPAND